MAIKGQVNIHFVIGTLIFVSLSIYLVYLTMSFYPEHSENIRSDILYTKAYLISELLIKSEGYPENWNKDNFERVGLASKPYLLDSAKLAEFNEVCNSTNITKIQKLKDSFGLERENLIVEIKYLNNTDVMECKPVGKKIGTTAYIKRMVILNNNFVEVNVYVG